jgi:hypothetical protein
MGTVPLSAGEADASFLEPANDIVAELDNLRFARIAELGAINENLWGTIRLAAERGEPLTIEQFYRIAAQATRETFSLMRAVGTAEAVQ